MDLLDILFIAFVGLMCVLIAVLGVVMPAFVFSWVASSSIKRDED